MLVKEIYIREQAAGSKESTASAFVYISLLEAVADKRRFAEYQEVGGIQCCAIAGIIKYP